MKSQIQPSCVQTYMGKLYVYKTDCPIQRLEHLHIDNAYNINEHMQLVQYGHAYEARTTSIHIRIKARLHSTEKIKDSIF